MAAERHRLLTKTSIKPTTPRFYAREWFILKVIIAAPLSFSPNLQQYRNLGEVATKSADEVPAQRLGGVLHPVQLLHHTRDQAQRIIQLLWLHMLQCILRAVNALGILLRQEERHLHLQLTERCMIAVVAHH